MGAKKYMEPQKELKRSFYVKTKLAKLFRLILSHPVALTLPEIEDFWGRECLNESVPSFDKKQYDYVDLSQDLVLAVAPIQELLD